MPLARIKFTDRSYRTVEDLSIKLDTDMSGVLSRGLCLLDYMLHCTREGKEFVILSPDGSRCMLDLSEVIG